MTVLIVLRGPSGSGKSTVAKAVREAFGDTMALIEQDHFRRIVLKEKDIPNGLNIELIKRTVLFALEHGRHVILEGILDAGRYEAMLKEVTAIHPEQNHFFYFDISLEETIRRHQTKPNKDDFGEKELRLWYKRNNLLSFVTEHLVHEQQTVDQIRDNILSICEYRSG